MDTSAGRIALHAKACLRRGAFCDNVEHVEHGLLLLARARNQIRKRGSTVKLESWGV